MRCVGLDPAQWNPPLWRWQASVAPRPHAFGAAKVGDAGIGADARAREGDEVLAFNDPPSDCLDGLFEALFLGHAICPQVGWPIIPPSLRILRFSRALPSPAAVLALVGIHLLADFQTRVEGELWHH